MAVGSSLPDLGLYVDVQLDLVAIGIQDVEAVGDRVVGGTDNRYARLDDPIPRFSELLVGLADLEAEVLHPDSAPLGDGRRVGTYFDQKQFVVRPAGREGGSWEASGRVPRVSRSNPGRRRRPA